MISLGIETEAVPEAATAAKLILLATFFGLVEPPEKLGKSLAYLVGFASSSNFAEPFLIVELTLTLGLLATALTPLNMSSKEDITNLEVTLLSTIVLGKYLPSSVIKVTVKQR